MIAYLNWRNSSQFLGQYKWFQRFNKKLPILKWRQIFYHFTVNCLKQVPLAFDLYEVLNCVFVKLFKVLCNFFYLHLSTFSVSRSFDINLLYIFKSSFDKDLSDLTKHIETFLCFFTSYFNFLWKYVKLLILKLNSKFHCHFKVLLLIDKRR